MTVANSESRSKRVGQLDLFRYLTVTLAIISHIVIHHAIYDETEGGLAMVFKVITRMATPSLLVLMGVMIEIAHVRRMPGREPEVMASVLYRAFLCAGTYLVFSLVNDFFGLMNQISGPSGPQWATTGYGAIFLTYALLLMIAPLWLWIRVSFGFLPLVTISIVGVAIHAFFIADLPALSGPLYLPGSVLLGIGGDRGPTVLHALGLMTFGMAMGNVFFARERQPWSRLTVVAGAAVSALLLGILIGYWGAGRTAHFISNIEHWRHHNHVGYYAFGILAALGILGLTYAIYPLLSERVRTPLQAIGSSTLVYFFLGSVLLQAVPLVQITSAVIAVPVIILYLVVFGALTLMWRHFAKDSDGLEWITATGRGAIETVLRRTLWRETTQR